MSPSTPKAIVIGAGILGASIAYHLARRGAAVTVIERGQAAGGATADSFAWINAAYGNAKPYFQLRLHAMQDWRRLERELDGAARVNWCGCLSWDLSDEELDDYAQRYAAWGYEVRLVERAQIAALEPGLIDPPARAAYAAGEGTIEPVAATRALLEAAQARGAALRLDTEVTGFRAGTNGVKGVETQAGPLEADMVVLTAGVESAGLAGQLGLHLPLEASPGLLMHCKPAARLFERVVEAPGLHMKQELDGRIVAGESFGGGPVPNDPEAEGARLLKTIKSRLRGAEALELERVSVGLRPIPADGLPAVGFTAENLYLAVMHSGVTLAPAIGRFAAQEMLDGVRVELLAPYRPERFSGA